MSLMPALPALASLPASGGALIASPSSVLRDHILHRLNGRCLPVQQAQGGAEALAKLEHRQWQVLYLDCRLPDLDPEELRAIIQRRFPQIAVVMLDSEQEGNEQEIEKENTKENHEESYAAKLGPAASFLQWPAPVARGQASRSGSVNLPVLTTATLPGMIGSSEAMQRVYRLVRLVAPRTTTVLIAGSTGTGKELVARALHALSPRAAKPLIVVNCAAIPETLLESELFGHTRGAFTGAVQAQLGRIPAAHGGTLFLDEVSELPLGMQAKLLRFLEQKEIQRLGTCEVTKVDVRVLAATNIDLAGRAARGEFRQDLFYRLSAFPIELPPLAARRADIIPLAEYFLSCMAAAMEMRAPQLSQETMQVLENHPWGGNVRELQHVMERASILVEGGDTLQPEHLFFAFPASVSA
jgi:DNA-binding NtrC family response regulator